MILAHAFGNLVSTLMTCWGDYGVWHDWSEYHGLVECHLSPHTQRLILFISVAVVPGLIRLTF